MKTNGFLRLLLILAVLFTLTPRAGASTIYTLDRDACTGTCGIGPFATLTLEQTTAGMVTITEVLAASDVFAGTGTGEALEFNIAGPITIGSMSAGFSTGPSPATASAFGRFLYSVTCWICQGGKLINPSELAFTVTSPGGITVQDFIANDRGYSFASDIRGSNGNTGNVAVIRNSVLLPGPDPEALVTESFVPEPVTVVLVGAALLGLGVLRRRRT